MDGSLVFYDATLLDALHKVLQLHVRLWQLEALYSTFILSFPKAALFPLLVPLHPTDEPFQLCPSVRLWGVYQTQHNTFNMDSAPQLVE